MRHLTYLLLISLVLTCEQNHIFKDLEYEEVVYLGLDSYSLDSIPPEIGQLKKVQELVITQDTIKGWIIYPPLSAIAYMADKPPFKTIPEELTALNSLKN